MIGHIRDKGGTSSGGKIEPFSIDFTYTGGIQKYTVPVTGLYKLEVWGAKGYNSSGGYSVGWRIIKKGTALYICCGGAGSATSAYSTGGNGYNGGGKGCSNHSGGGGGGATHIALITGTLAEIGYDDFVTNAQGLIVAGGGGAKRASATGSGGGSNGGNGSNGATGGSQTSGGSNGSYGSNPVTTYLVTPTFGIGGGYLSGNVTEGYIGIVGGGGGFFGGGCVRTNNNEGYSATGGGGSGWIDGVSALVYKNVVYNPSTENGINSGNGKAKISFITK